LAHFGLPYEWSTFDFGDLPAQLVWALFTLNFSWGVLLLAVGGLVVQVAKVGPTSERLTRRFVFAVGLSHRE
jgi:hypothetical protein